MRYRPDVKSPKYLDNNIVNGYLVDHNHDFIEILNKTHPSGDPTHIPKQTFSRLLQEFLQDKRIKPMGVRLSNP